MKAINGGDSEAGQAGQAGRPDRPWQEKLQSVDGGRWLGVNENCLSSCQSWNGHVRRTWKSV